MSASVGLKDLRLVEKRRRMSRWVRRLRSAYERPPEPRERLALDQLVLEHLLDGMAERRAGSAFQLLKSEFVDWNEVRVTRESDLVKVLEAADLSKEQASTLRNVLATLFERTNAVTLEHLRGKPLHEIDVTLGALGVSKRARNTMAFLRLDANVLALAPSGLRVLRRLGAVPTSAEADEAIAQLTLVVAAAARADFYWLLTVHARRTCKDRGPRCRDCVLLKDCPTGESRTTDGPSAGLNTSKRASQEKKR